MTTCSAKLSRRELAQLLLPSSPLILLLHFPFFPRNNSLIDCLETRPKSRPVSYMSALYRCLMVIKSNWLFVYLSMCLDFNCRRTALNSLQRPQRFTCSSPFSSYSRLLCSRSACLQILRKNVLKTMCSLRVVTRHGAASTRGLSYLSTPFIFSRYSPYLQSILLLGLSQNACSNCSVSLLPFSSRPSLRICCSSRWKSAAQSCYNL